MDGTPDVLPPFLHDPVAATAKRKASGPTGESPNTKKQEPKASTSTGGSTTPVPAKKKSGYDTTPHGETPATMKLKKVRS